MKKKHEHPMRHFMNWKICKIDADRIEELYDHLVKYSLTLEGDVAILHELLELVKEQGYENGADDWAIG